MAATIIDGTAIAKSIRDEVRTDALRLKAGSGIVPGLAFILVGEDPASAAYVRMKGLACEEAGFYSVTERLNASVTQAELLRLVDGFNRDPRLHGILVQLPLPPHIKTAAILSAVLPSKDVDGFHPVNAGLLASGEPCMAPCTPLGVVEMLSRSGVATSGKHAVIIGRSTIVGRPLASLLLRKPPGPNAIVTVLHSAATDIAGYCRTADILVAAIGRPAFVTAPMVAEGATVIDVGINRVDDASRKSGFRLVGDVDFDAVSRKAGKITPVPGGVGPMTIAMLLKNTLNAASAGVKTL